MLNSKTFPLNSDGEAENLYQMAASALYSTAPDATFGLKLQETDAEGRVTRYLYDSDTGLLTALIYPDGTGIAYSYNAKNELVAVSHISAYNAQSGSYTQASIPAAQYTYNTDGTLSEMSMKRIIAPLQ